MLPIIPPPYHDPAKPVPPIAAAPAVISPSFISRPTRPNNCTPLHDWTSHRLDPDDTLAPQLERRARWLAHDFAGCAAIGLFPCARTFRWHDVAARRMVVGGRL